MAADTINPFEAFALNLDDEPPLPISYTTEGTARYGEFEDAQRVAEMYAGGGGADEMGLTGFGAVRVGPLKDGKGGYEVWAIGISGRIYVLQVEHCFLPRDKEGVSQCSAS